MRYLLIVLILAALAMGPVATHFAARASDTGNGAGAVTVTTPPPATMLDGIDWDEWLMLDGIDWDEWLMSIVFTLPPLPPITP
jgi:hypothetical protein